MSSSPNPFPLEQNISMWESWRSINIASISLFLFYLKQASLLSSLSIEILLMN